MLYMDKVKIITSRTFGKYTIEVFNFADTWLVKDQPAPANWNELVYRVIKDGKKVEKFPDRIARIGNELVQDLKRYRTADGENAFIMISNWLHEPPTLTE